VSNRTRRPGREGDRLLQGRGVNQPEASDRKVGAQIWSRGGVYTGPTVIANLHRLTRNAHHRPTGTKTRVVFVRGIAD